ncbi:hypothetical protein AJ80_06419 [Polytolypa hystricis UAMH7299]|uniref:Uncharacterized protein n=1 Tax=Polytolypa hystricis (strain UAMH7299) TaxID=1447883 RepID=A0A2B7XWK8_POLH7|nr:hypothetical protein AJ80_06419 [Polytolypa hystricis UAMH7299]
MASRHHHHIRDPSPSRSSSNIASTSVRRNIFQHHLSRRPTPTSTVTAPSVLPSTNNTNTNNSSAGNATTTTSGSSGGAANGGLLSSSSFAGSHHPHASKALPTTAVSLSSVSASASAENGDIVARDKNGGYKVDVPILPAGMWGEDTDDGGSGVGGGGMEGIDGSGGPGGGGTGAGEEGISGMEKENLRAEIEEMCRNRNLQMSSEPSEILLLIQQSLRNKVSALDEDRWMYEADDEIRV